MLKSLKSVSIAVALVLGAAAPIVHAEEAKTVVAIEKPAAGTSVLIMKPKVSLAILTAAGARDPKADWSDNARNYMTTAIDKRLKDKSYSTLAGDADSYTSPRAVQIIKLNNVVTGSIEMNRWVYFKLPTKTNFEWSLGEGAQTLVPNELAGTEGAPRYALFLNCEGAYSSGGRVALAVTAAAFGAAVPMGGQWAQASLVDLKTGQVVWYQYQIVGAGTDIRTPEGAAAFIDTLLANMPL